MRKLLYVFLLLLVLAGLIFGRIWMESSKNEKIPQAAKTELVLSPTILSKEKNIESANLEFAKVVNIIDGDTIEVDFGDGNIRKVRYIGIDTPESVDPRKPVQCFSKESTAKNKELVLNKVVGLEKDISETDRYGRLLRYVYLKNLFINQTLVAEGYANAVSYPPDIKYQDQLRQAEQQARSENKGLWGICKTFSSRSDEADCKYPCVGKDRDCSDFSSHEETQEFFSCCGFTAYDDPMNLDAVGIGDGIACENI